MLDNFLNREKHKNVARINNVKTFLHVWLSRSCDRQIEGTIAIATSGGSIVHTCRFRPNHRPRQTREQDTFRVKLLTGYDACATDG